MNLSSLSRIVLLAVLASGCTTFKLEELKRTEPVGSAFHKELARYYLRFAEHEAEDFDWIDSQHFAVKGLLAAYGKDITPENPADWKLPADTVAAIAVARETLTKTLDMDTINLFPDHAARALFSYDCWIEQQEENTDEKSTAACRDNFNESIAAIAKERTTPHEASPEPAAATSAEPAPFDVTTTSYVVFFDKDSSAVTIEGYKAIKQIASDLEPISDYEVVIQGNAETDGTSAEYVEALAELRTETVRKALRELGVNENTMIISNSGKSPETPARKNRRVEIFVTH